MPIAIILTFVRTYVCTYICVCLGKYKNALKEGKSIICLPYLEVNRRICCNKCVFCLLINDLEHQKLLFKFKNGLKDQWLFPIVRLLSSKSTNKYNLRILLSDYWFIYKNFILFENVIYFVFKNSLADMTTIRHSLILFSIALYSFFQFYFQGLQIFVRWNLCFQFCYNDEISKI